MPDAISIAGRGSKYKTHGHKLAGFLGGLWHGMIAPLMFRVSPIAPSIRIYKTNNAGRCYDFGFILYIGALASHWEVSDNVTL